jgi:hypothetical protein
MNVSRVETSAWDQEADVLYDDAQVTPACRRGNQRTLTAVLLTQGLKSRGEGAHALLAEAVGSQLASALDLTGFGWMQSQAGTCGASPPAKTTNLGTVWVLGPQT